MHLFDFSTSNWRKEKEGRRTDLSASLSSNKYVGNSIITLIKLKKKILGFALIDATNAQFPMSKDAIEKALFKAKKTQWMSLRANTTRFEVPPGKYIILPMTTSNQDLKFMLRVFSEMPVNLKQVNSIAP